MNFAAGFDGYNILEDLKNVLLQVPSPTELIIGPLAVKSLKRCEKRPRL